MFFQAYSSLGTGEVWKPSVALSTRCVWIPVHLCVGIVISWYISLSAQLLHNSTVEDVASRYSKTPSQVLLRWAVQKGIGNTFSGDLNLQYCCLWAPRSGSCIFCPICSGVIPKSSSPQHVRENTGIFGFEISGQDMELLDSLNKDHHFCWDPTDVA